MVAPGWAGSAFNLPTDPQTLSPLHSIQSLQDPLLNPFPVSEAASLWRRASLQLPLHCEQEVGVQPHLGIHSPRSHPAGLGASWPPRTHGFSSGRRAPSCSSSCFLPLLRDISRGPRPCSAPQLLDLSHQAPSPYLLPEPPGSHTWVGGTGVES